MKLIYLRLLILFVALIGSTTLIKCVTWEEARKEYYKAVEDGDNIEKAEELFSELKNQQEFKGVAQTYIGSLTAMKAQYVLWPGTKLEYANSGIDIMEGGLRKDPDNLEALFIYGTTCYYMPFFMGMSDEAEEALKKIVKVYPDAKNQYHPDILENAFLFILEEIELTPEEKKKVYTYLGEVKSD